MKRQSTPTTAATAPPTPAGGLQGKLGLLLGLLLAGIFAYPAAVNPQESMILIGLMALMGPALALLLTREGGGATRRWAGAAGSLPVLAGWGLAAWAWLRWIVMDQHYAGRESVLGWLAFAAALTLGAACGALQPDGAKELQATDDELGESSFVVLRRVMAVASVGFGLFAIYQHFVSMPALLEAFRAENPGTPADVYTQSMIYALEQGRPGGRLGPTNLFAAQLALLATFCVATLRAGEKTGWRIVGALGLIAAAGGILLTRSRGGMLTFGLMLAAGGWLLLRGRRGARPGMANGTMALIALGLLHAAQAGAQAASWGERLANISTIRERLYYWSIALKTWGRDPLAGSGPGSFEYYYLQYKPELARESQHAHSWLLELGCSLGIMGVALALLVIAGVVWRLRHARQGEARWLGLGAAVLAINGLFEFSLEWIEFRIAAGLMIGACCGLTAQASATEQAAPVGVRRLYLLLLVPCALSAGVLWMGYRGTMAQDLRFRAEDHAAIRGEEGEALRLYQRAEAYAPADPRWPLAQAEMLTRMGRGAEAWPLLERAAKFNPQSASIPAQQGAWLAKYGRAEEARKYLDLAVERYGSNVAHRLARAELELRLGDTAAARGDLDWILAHTYLTDVYLQPRVNALKKSLELPGQ